MQSLQRQEIASAILDCPPRGPSQIHHPGWSERTRLPTGGNWLRSLHPVSRRPCCRARVLSLQYHFPEDCCLLLQEHAEEPQGRGRESSSSIMVGNTANRLLIQLCWSCSERQQNDTLSSSESENDDSGNDSDSTNPFRGSDVSRISPFSK